jgi:putative hydroxymethylpyrimidine transport system substrate-binding protein
MMHTSKVKVFAVAAALAVGCLAAMNADAAELKKIKFAILTQPNIWDAGTFAAIDQKYFQDEGLDVELISPAIPPDGMKLVASGGADFATAHSTDVLNARNSGLPIVSVATTHQYGTAGVMIPAESGVTDVKGLAGKTIGVTGIPFNRTMLEYSLNKAGVAPSDVNIVVVGFTPIPLLLSHRIDALGDAITWSEPAAYNAQIGKDPSDKSTYTFFPFFENGVPRYYTFGIVTSEEKVKSDPETIRKFLRAWQKGLDYMVKNQAAAAEGVLSRHPEINKPEAIANLAEIARITVSPETDAHGIGWQDPAVWEAQAKFMQEQGLIKDVDVSKAMTNEFLPAKP